MGGLAGDLLVARLRPSPARPWAFRAFATVVPVVLWLVSLLVLPPAGRPEVDAREAQRVSALGRSLVGAA